MPLPRVHQIISKIGVDVGGTFTDLLAWDGQQLHVIKIPSTPPKFHEAVVESVRRVHTSDQSLSIVHGSTVATNALLQRRVEPVAFVTTDGFRDMLLIGRQNRPQRYALRVERPRPITPQTNWFTVSERIDPHGQIVEPLTDVEIDRLIGRIKSAELGHVAVCLLFSFVNPVHEQRIAERCHAAGLTVTLSSDVLPEFREYERASTTTISAALRPVVQQYLEQLEAGLTELNPGAPGHACDLRIMHSAGGTMRATDAARHAVRLLLSGPAGGVIGAAYVARQAGFSNIISYDMGGTSTDVATVLDSRPTWTTATTIDGLPIALPMFEIETIGAGGGSIAWLDAGGALRVGPRSAGAEPGPACYARGGTEPTVTDANLVLGRILPDHFLGGAMRLHAEAAMHAIDELGRQLNKSRIETALGIVRIVEANMAHAVRAVTSRRGRDPRQFTLVSFGGAGGLHACGIAEILDIPRVLVPPYAGVLSALGMLVAPAIVDASKTVVSVESTLHDDQMRRVFDELRAKTQLDLPDDQTESIEQFADVRFLGQSHELTVPVEQMALAHIEERFHTVYTRLYGQVPQGRQIQIVALRVRRIGRELKIELPSLDTRSPGSVPQIELRDSSGTARRCEALRRHDLLRDCPREGPILITDPEATTYVPQGWIASARPDGAVVLERPSR